MTLETFGLVVIGMTLVPFFGILIADMRRGF